MFAQWSGSLNVCGHPPQTAIQKNVSHAVWHSSVHTIKNPPFSSAQPNESASYRQPTPHSGCRGSCPNFLSHPHPLPPNALLSLYSSLHFPWKSFTTENVSTATSFNRFHSGEDRRWPFSNVQSTMMIISE